MCEKLEKCVKSWKVWSGGVVPGLNIVACVRKVAIVGFFFIIVHFWNSQNGFDGLSKILPVRA